VAVVAGFLARIVLDFSRSGRCDQPRMLRARTIGARLVRQRAMLSGTSNSPSSRSIPTPAAGEKLSKAEEQKERVKAMEELMREQTMRDVAAASAARHDPDSSASEYAANYDEDRDEWGGPKGAEPTRYGDWDVRGRASDF